MFLHLTTVRDLDGEPIAAVDAQFIGGVFSHTYMVIATDPGHLARQRWARGTAAKSCPACSTLPGGMDRFAVLAPAALSLRP